MSRFETHTDQLSSGLWVWDGLMNTAQGEAPPACFQCANYPPSL